MVTIGSVWNSYHGITRRKTVNVVLTNPARLHETTRVEFHPHDSLVVFRWDLLWAHAFREAGSAAASVIVTISPTRLDGYVTGINGEDSIIFGPFDVPAVPGFPLAELVAFGKSIRANKPAEPLIDWFQDRLPEPWSQLGVEPHKFFAAVCPVPLAGVSDA